MSLNQNEENNLEKLKIQILQLNALNNISLELTRTTDLDALLNKIIEYAALIVKAEAASILLLDKKKNELYFKASLGKKSKEIKKYRVKVGEGIAELALPKVNIVSNLRGIPREKKAFQVEKRDIGVYYNLVNASEAQP